jgi:hypothetical protein
MFEKGCRKARREGGRKYPVIPKFPVRQAKLGLKGEEKTMSP